MSQSHAQDVNVTLPPEPEKATLEGKNKVLGFWLFLGGETVLFGTLFGSFIALRNQFNDGPTADELFSIPLVALATAILLTSSLFSVMWIQALHKSNLKGVQFWLIMTVIFGLGFLALEIYEFYHYASMGHTFGSSAFGSSFYSLVGFHGAHVAFGIGWMITLILQLSKKKLTVVTAPKVYLMALYWHFIDVVWVFIFTIVYLMGKVG